MNSPVTFVPGSVRCSSALCLFFFNWNDSIQCICWWHNFCCTLASCLLKVNVDTFFISDYVVDPEARYCLFYAACRGGHLDLVKKWATASTDVNLPVAFVGNLVTCETKYPLFAACSGNLNCPTEIFELSYFGYTMQVITIKERVQ